MRFALVFKRKRKEKKSMSKWVLGLLAQNLIINLFIFYYYYYYFMKRESN